MLSTYQKHMFKLWCIWTLFNCITICMVVGIGWMLCYSLYKQTQEEQPEMIIGWLCVGLISTHALWTMARDLYFPKDHPNPFTS